MAQEEYTVEGRQFRTAGDYARARRDKELIDRLRAENNFSDRSALEKLRADLNGGKYKFMTILGQDFLEEVEERIKQPAAPAQGKTRRGAVLSRGGAGRSGKPERPSYPNGRTAEAATGKKADSKVIDAYVKEELRRREKRRKAAIAVCSVLAVGCLGYFGVYFYHEYRTQSTYDRLSALKDLPTYSAQAPTATSGPLFTLNDDEPEQREVLEEYKKLLNANKKLIGWLKIDDTNIDYPVMQTSDNEYYLTHNMNQERDNNGTIFMDKDCNVLKPSTNYILYGHHMQSGKMFGRLGLYEKKSYCEEHPYIQFDTIYEKGIYQVMYVFRSRVYSEEEVVFKYYQFIDANSEQEFDSYMDEMAAISLYDTGVTAEYGDHLLTLSTCDYQEKNGRFVVVAKKVAKEQ